MCLTIFGCLKVWYKFWLNKKFLHKETGCWQNRNSIHWIKQHWHLVYQNWLLNFDVEKKCLRDKNLCYSNTAWVSLYYCNFVCLQIETLSFSIIEGETGNCAVPLRKFKTFPRFSDFPRSYELSRLITRLLTHIQRFSY